MRFIQLVSIVLLLGTSLMALCQSEEAENRIVELEAKWSGMFSERDLDGIMALMAKNSVLIMPGAAPIVGIEDIRHATKTMLESGDQVSWKSGYAQVSSSGDMAYDYGTATTKLVDGSSVQGHYLVVWVKEDGIWKVAADMFN